jgi:MinD superfamily P-loop ATPase
MKTLVIASGKGGAGKTSLAAGLLPFLPEPVLADADVDASNLPLLVHAVRRVSEPFVFGRQASIDADLCAGCLDCVEICRFQALAPPDDGSHAPSVDALSCEGCSACRTVCPTGAISMIDATCGEWYLSTTAYGPMVHARLGPGGENSGALVERVRREAAREAEETGRRMVLVDAPPGIGCPVISSLTGADFVLAVTEPTPSGASDLLRLLDLARHFRIPSAVVINKFDLHSNRAEELAAGVEALGVPVVARFPYDEAVSCAIREGRLLSQYSPSWHDRFQRLWADLRPLLGEEELPAERLLQIDAKPSHELRGGHA